MLALFLLALFALSASAAKTPPNDFINNRGPGTFTCYQWPIGDGDPNNADVLPIITGTSVMTVQAPWNTLPGYSTPDNTDRECWLHLNVLGGGVATVNLKVHTLNDQDISASFGSKILAAREWVTKSEDGSVWWEVSWNKDKVKDAVDNFVEDQSSLSIDVKELAPPWRISWSWNLSAYNDSGFTDYYGKKIYFEDSVASASLGTLSALFVFLFLALFV